MKMPPLEAPKAKASSITVAVVAVLPMLLLAGGAAARIAYLQVGALPRLPSCILLLFAVCLTTHESHGRLLVAYGPLPKTLSAGLSAPAWELSTPAVWLPSLVCLPDLTTIGTIPTIPTQLSVPAMLRGPNAWP